MKFLSKIISSVLFAVVLCGLLMTVSAQSTELFKGAEQPIFKSDKDEKEQCFVYNKYVVKTVLKDNAKPESNSQGTGYEIDIFKRDAANSLQNNCQTSDKSLINIKNDEGNEFGGLFGNLLFIKRNVFPDGGDLDVYSLEANKVLFSTEYSEWDNYRINLSGENSLRYREWSKKDGLLKNCPNAKKWKREGFGISWLQTKRLDLKTFKKTNVGALRCINIQ